MATLSALFLAERDASNLVSALMRARKDGGCGLRELYAQPFLLILSLSLSLPPISLSVSLSLSNRNETKRV